MAKVPQEVMIIKVIASQTQSTTRTYGQSWAKVASQPF